jgi:outer membrane protein OmpA-like peptidoglycan-associated protein/tetratricopeptide (TPR) repeat protein
MRFIISLVWIIPFLGMSGSVMAQDDDCPLSENKKAVKAYEKAIDKKKYSYKERMIFFREALTLDEDFTVALWDKTFSQIKNSRSKQKPYQKTEDALKTVVEACPEIHSAAYFFLGEIYMNKDEFESAAKYYDQFMRFTSEDESKYERRYDEQMIIAKENFKLAQFLAYQYANPHPYNAKKIIPLSQDESDEYLPAISPDNEVMLFTRRVEVKQNMKESYIKNDHIVKVERFSVSNLTNEAFVKGQAFGPPFNMNMKANYGGSAISANNREIYYTVCEPHQGKMNCDIYYSKYEYSAKNLESESDWHWTEPKNLGPNINTQEGWESQPTISKDGKWMMYAVFKEGTRGIDLFQSKRETDGSWGKGESMGEPINTAGHEKSPFFHSDDKTLYFASKNGHMGMGGYDVFVSRFVDGKWTIPLNLGYPLNTPEDEHGYVVSLDGKTAYFGSASPYNGGNAKSLDVYSVTLPKKIRPDKVMMVKGTVKTLKGKAPKDAKIELRNTKTQEVESVEVDTIDGTFTAIVNIEDTADYVMTAKGKDLAFNNKLIKAPKEGEPIKTKVDVKVQKSKMGQHITIENIHFATNSADLSTDSRASLDALIAYMKEHPTFKVSIEGHTDNVGDGKTNLALSTDRAYSVMAYLQENGVSHKSLKFKGWGSAKPITTNSSAQGRAKNRRIEIVVLSM